VDTVDPVGDRSARGRLGGLDGIRGLAALFVVVHHCWLKSFPGFPANSGPAWTGFLVYGHLAVVVFIVLSGFSLGVAPARHDWHLDGLGRYAFRRAWRILPAYWPALLVSVVITLSLGGSQSASVRSVVVYGLLLQDVISAPPPNPTFWTIAVEAQLYLVLPVLLLLIRRAGVAAMVGTVLVLVLGIGLLAPHVPLVNGLMRITPQFAVGFAFGLAAAGVLRAGAPRLPWHWLATGAALPALVLIIIKGPVWTVEHYFWIDLAVVPAIALLLAGLATGHPAAAVGLLDTRPVRALGSFSYSLYLTHAPIVAAVARRLVRPHTGPGLTCFLLTLAIAVPATLIAARLFASVFELPFQRHKSWPALRTAIRTHLKRDPSPASTQPPV
jgi:peptidoglycan/LPS O-acetylase OafA/YrhL